MIGTPKYQTDDCCKSIFSDLQVSPESDTVFATEMVKEEEATASHVVYKQVNKTRKHKTDGSASREAPTPTKTATDTNRRTTDNPPGVIHASTAEVFDHVWHWLRPASFAFSFHSLFIELLTVAHACSI